MIRLRFDDTFILCPHPADSAGDPDVLRRYGHALGVGRAKVAVLEEADKVGLRGLLEHINGRRLEVEVTLEVPSDLASEPLERKLAD